MRFSAKHGRGLCRGQLSITGRPDDERVAGKLRCLHVRCAEPKQEAIFATIDPRERPAYPLAEAARYLQVAPATLRSWVSPRPANAGTRRAHALIHPPESDPTALSFNNLVEAHVLRSLRTEHGVSLSAVRQALQYAQHELDIDRLLLREDLRAGAGQLFLDEYGKLLNLSLSGQLAMRELLNAHLKRVEWDASSLPVRLYPFLPAADDSHRPIAIDPAVSFGRPVVFKSGVSTRAITERIDAGESVESLADDYGMGTSEIAQAVLYERAA